MNDTRRRLTLFNITRVVALGMLLALAAYLPLAQAGVIVEGVSHFKCYEVDDARNIDVLKQLADQIVELDPNVKIEEAKFFCTPVNKCDFVPPGEPQVPCPPPFIGLQDHLVCYEIETSVQAQIGTAVVTNQLGNQSYKIDDPELLCVPTSKAFITDPTCEIDPLSCPAGTVFNNATCACDQGDARE
ncbi:hypothetical protein MYX64_09450 [Nitrospinae bacterium AH_259_B05_G02_I21]|nr:hypothetical protein [Nitrospinae bacterium AH_259_B05_G02_I21]